MGANEEILRITAMGRHGEGIAGGIDGPVYVPFALPGERVRAAVEGKRGRLLEILEECPDRIEAFCPYFGVCGGCSVQHWRAEPYRGWKRGLVETALRHRGLEADVAPLVDAHGAGRRRVTLHVRFAGGHPAAGFMEARSHRLIDLDTCPILVPALAGAGDVARDLAVPLRGPAKALDVLLTASDAGLDVDIRGAVAAHGDGQLALSEAAIANDLARLSVNRELVVEQRTPTLRVGPAIVTLPTGAFLQATAAGEAALARLVGDGVAGARRVADLFCGVGPFALRLAEGSTVLAMDSSAPALTALDRAVRDTKGLKPVKIERRDLFRRPLSGEELKRFDAVVFDPPRAGAEAQAAELARSKVVTVVAVSCDPASFARDAATLVAGGYRIETVVPVDQFRYSGHVEVVAVLRRT